jgi:hypothetical protein
MDDYNETGLPDDLERVADRLRSERPRLDALELDAIRRRVGVSAGRTGSGTRRNSFMRSRLAITGMLVAGVLFSTTGAGLAVDGITANSAQNVQYKQDSTQPQQPRANDTLGVIGEIESEEPAAEESAPPAPAPAQAPRQAQAVADEGELPFTGFAAIPVLILGIGLLTSGLVLRRRASRDD